MHDACYRKTLAAYGGKWSARAAQAVAKCRKAHGHVKKSDAGLNLKRWEKERWVDKRTEKPCGSSGGIRTEYCRPTKKVSSKTPVMPHKNALKRAIATKVRTGHGPTFRHRKR